MPKNNRCGQAEILSDSDLSKIRRELHSPHHKLIFDIATWTGERWGAIVQLEVGDAYINPVLSIPQDVITFPRQIRKAAPDGRRDTRQVPVHPELREILNRYDPPLTGWLFPSEWRGNSGHLTKEAAFKFLRAACQKARLSHRGISSHSTRRTFITVLYQRGVDLKTLQKITGHRDIRALLRYVEISEDQVKAAIALR